MLRFACVIALCAAAAGCTAPDPFLVNGDANGAEVDYVGNVATAAAVAQKHCAQYDRVARYIGSGTDHAYFECDLH